MARLLVLGGTRFLGREVAAQAVLRGWEVTCAARGRSGSVPEGARFVEIDRDDSTSWPTTTGGFDVAVDVARRPSHVRSALRSLDDQVAHWVFVSSISVYADEATPGQDVSSPLLPPLADGDETDPANYGHAKVACEQAITGTRGGDDALLVRAGVIVGPEDMSDRFVYWVDRVSRGGPILVPGTPDDLVQFVDVRDLAGLILDAGAARIGGTLDGVGPPISRGAFLRGIARGLDVDLDLVWADQSFLSAQQVNPWLGERSLPFWLPLPDHAGVMSRDVSSTLSAGLRVRSLESTSADTLAWMRRTQRLPSRAGLSPDEEEQLLRQLDMHI